jgi:putative membrane protein
MHGIAARREARLGPSRFHWAGDDFKSVRCSMFSHARRFAAIGVLGLLMGCSRSNGMSNSDNPARPDTLKPTTGPMANSAATSIPASPAASGTEGAAAMAAPTPLTDQQIAAITDGANSAEIDQAKIAEPKAKSPKVKQFAAKMIKHHGEAKDKQAKLDIKQADSPISKQNAKDAAATLATLKAAASGADFDTLYMKDQIEEHQKVLTALTDELLPNAKDAGLKSYLGDIKPVVMHHLKDAREIERSLQSTTASNAE